MARGGAQRLSTETKAFSKSSEFWVWAITVAAVLIADRMLDSLSVDRAWSLAVYASIGYMISRGLAKAGSREPFWSDGTNANRDSDGTASVDLSDKSSRGVSR
jgi:hypothetical protein